MDVDHSLGREIKIKMFTSLNKGKKNIKKKKVPYKHYLFLYYQLYVKKEDKTKCNKLN
jgi:hypothetical protein